MQRLPRALRLLPLLPVAVGGLALAPAALSAPVTPVAECTLPGTAGLTAYFGYDNPGAAIQAPVGPSNAITPPPADRGQPTIFAPGRQRGVVGVAIDPVTGTASWLLDTDAAAPPQVATARTSTPRCAPNLVLTMAGPPTLTAGELVDWSITVTHAGYPDIADAIEPFVGIPVGAIAVDVPGWGRFGLEPDSVPADGQLRPGRSLTYRWSGRFGTEICVDKVEETVEAVMRVNGVTESTTADNTATATSRVVPCLTDLAVTKTADREHAAVGDVVTWTLGVVNAGNTGVRISDITVTDPQLSDLAPVDPPADGWLPAGATLRYRGTQTAAACGAMQNSAQVSLAPAFGSPDTNPVDDAVTATVAVDLGACAPPAPVTPPATPTPPAPPGGPTACPATTLALTVAAPQRGVAGGRLTVRLVATNTGSAAARKGVLRYRIPSGASLATAPADAVVRGGIATLRLGRLTPGARRTAVLVLGLDGNAGPRVHRADARAACASAAAALARTAVGPKSRVRVPAVTG